MRVGYYSMCAYDHATWISGFALHFVFAVQVLERLNCFKFWFLLRWPFTITTSSSWLWDNPHDTVSCGRSSQIRIDCDAFIAINRCICMWTICIHVWKGARHLQMCLCRCLGLFVFVCAQLLTRNLSLSVSRLHCKWETAWRMLICRTSPVIGSISWLMVRTRNSVIMFGLRRSQTTTCV